MTSYIFHNSHRVLIDSGSKEYAQSYKSHQHFTSSVKFGGTLTIPDENGRLLNTVVIAIKLL